MASPVDFSEVRNLAHKLWGQCRDSSGPWTLLTDSVRHMRNLVEEVESHLDKTPTLGPNDERLLDQIRDGQVTLHSLELALARDRCIPKPDVDQSAVDNFKDRIDVAVKEIGELFHAITNPGDAGRMDVDEVADHNAPATPASLDPSAPATSGSPARSGAPHSRKSSNALSEGRSDTVESVTTSAAASHSILDDPEAMGKEVIDYNSADYLQASANPLYGWMSSDASPKWDSRPFSDQDPLSILSMSLDEAAKFLNYHDNDEEPGQNQSKADASGENDRLDDKAQEPKVTPFTVTRLSSDKVFRDKTIEREVISNTGLGISGWQGGLLLPPLPSLPEESHSVAHEDHLPVNEQVINPMPPSRHGRSQSDIPHLNIIPPPGSGPQGSSASADLMKVMMDELNVLFNTRDVPRDDTTRSPSQPSSRASSAKQPPPVPPKPSNSPSIRTASPNGSTSNTSAIKRFPTHQGSHESLYTTSRLASPVDSPQQPGSAKPLSHNNQGPSSASVVHIKTASPSGYLTFIPRADPEGLNGHFSVGAPTRPAPPPPRRGSSPVNLHARKESTTSSTHLEDGATSSNDRAESQEGSVGRASASEDGSTGLRSPRRQVEEAMFDPRRNDSLLAKSGQIPPIKREPEPILAVSHYLPDMDSATRERHREHQSVYGPDGDNLQMDRVWHCIHFFNESSWMDAESKLIEYHTQLIDQSDHALARRARHLLGICASFTGHYARAISLFLSVIKTPIRSLEDLDDGDCAAAYWLGDAYTMLNRRTEAVLAYCIAEHSSLFNDPNEPDLVECVTAEQEAVMLGRSREDLKLDWVRELLAKRNKREPSIIDQKVVEQSAIKELFDSSATQFTRGSRPAKFSLGQAKSRCDFMAGLLDVRSRHNFRNIKITMATFDPDAEWPLRFDPFFAMANVQRGRLLVHESDLLQVFTPTSEAKIASTGPKGLNRWECCTSDDLTWLITTIRHCLRLFEMDWTEVANVHGTWFVIRYSVFEGKVATTHYCSISLFKQSLRSRYGAQICPEGIWGARVFSMDPAYEKGVKTSQIKGIKAMIRDQINKEAKLRTKQRRRPGTRKSISLPALPTVSFPISMESVRNAFTPKPSPKLI